MRQRPIFAICRHGSLSQIQWAFIACCALLWMEYTHLRLINPSTMITPIKGDEIKFKKGVYAGKKGWHSSFQPSNSLEDALWIGQRPHQLAQIPVCFHKTTKISLPLNDLSEIESHGPYWLQRTEQALFCWQCCPQLWIRCCQPSCRILASNWKTPSITLSLG